MTYLFERKLVLMLCLVFFTVGSCLFAAERFEASKLPINAIAINGKRLGLTIVIPKEFRRSLSLVDNHMAVNEFILEEETHEEPSVARSLIIRTRDKNYEGVSSVKILVQKFKEYLQKNTHNSVIVLKSIRQKESYKTVQLAAAYTYMQQRLFMYMSLYEGVTDWSGFEYGMVLPNQQSEEIDTITNALKIAQEFEQKNVLLMEY